MLGFPSPLTLPDLSIGPRDLAVSTISTHRTNGYGSFLAHSHSVQEGGDIESMSREWVSGYHSDSAVPRSPARLRGVRSKGSLRDMMDPATQPLIDDADSDRERPTMVEGYIDEELAAHPVMLPHFVEEKFRSPVNLDEFFQTPRKARWNKKVTRKRSARPVPTVRKGRLAAYCVSAELTTEKLQRWLLNRKKDRGNNSYLSQQANGSSIHSSMPGPPGNGISASLVGLEWRDKNYMGVVYTTNDDGKCDPLDAKHIFIFPYGALCFWGCTKQEEEAFIEMCREFMVEPVSKLEMEESYDDLSYLYGEHSRIWNYEITLVSNDPEEKLALSFSLAQSAKLFVFEDRVDTTITSSKNIPVELADKGVIKLSRTEISKLTGQVFLERNEVNLHSDILDTPEFFWEADVWEPLYKKFSSYLDIPNRIEILNKRLDILKELLDVLNTQLENNHSTKLEWIVISLIVVEVVLQVLEIFLNDIMGMHFRR